MKLYLLICNFEKFRTVNEIAFNSARLLAQKYGFDVSVAYISHEKYTTKEQIDAASKDYPNVNFYLYSNTKSENECIFDGLSKQSADRYFVCDARYLEREDIMDQMLDAASYYGVHFVRCNCEYNGVFEGVVKSITKLNNKILNFVSSASFSPYVRNFVIFDNVVFSYMQRSPTRSGRIRETDYLINTVDAVIKAPDDFKKAKHFNQNWLGITTASISLFLSLWCFICIFIASTNFDTTSWLIVGIIAFGVIGFVLMLISCAGVRTSFYKLLEKRSECEPIYEKLGVKHSLNKGKEAKEQKVSQAVAKEFEIKKQEEKKKTKSTKKVKEEKKKEKPKASSKTTTSKAKKSNAKSE